MSKVSITPVVYANRQRADGSYDVKIRITFKRRSAYLSTNLIAKASDVAKTGALRPSFIASKASVLVNEIRDIIAPMPISLLENLDIQGVVSFIKDKMKEKEGFRLDFLEYGRNLTKKMKPSTAISYITALNALRRYAGTDTVDISRITVKFLRGFEEYLRTAPDARAKTIEARSKPTARRVSKYPVCLRHIYNCARLEFNEPDTGVIRIPISPFDYYKIPRQNPSHHRNKSDEFIQKMIDSRPSLVGLEKFGVDVFLIGFMLMGINVADLYELELPKDDVFTYYRRKTRDRRDDRAEHRIRIEECLKPYLKEYGSSTRAFGFYHTYKSAEMLSRGVNAGLKRWAINHGEEPFTMYACRHSWASIAYSSKCRISKSIISEGLAHSDSATKVDDIYIEKDWKNIWDANKTVLDLFKWD